MRRMSSPATEYVRLEVADGVGTIRLDRPKMNAISLQVQEELRIVAAEASEREDVKAVVVYGGERVFAAGNDVKEMDDLDYTDIVRLGAGVQSAVTAVARIPKPVVAAITGYALGGGCELALAADVRFAHEKAVLGQPEILLGIIPGAGGTQRLSRLVGPSKAKDLIFTGRFVPADEALAIGLVDRVVAGESPAASTRRPWPGPRSSPAPRRTPCARRRRPSTAGSRWTSRRAWRSSGRSSPRFSRPRTGRRVCNPSSRTDPARPSSRAGRNRHGDGARRQTSQLAAKGTSGTSRRRAPRRVTQDPRR